MGNAFGAGMRANMQEAYQFLINHWVPGDRLYIFGFSRGAYCAGSRGDVASDRCDAARR
jgi:uncharacterized protein (DUF2235 family)